MKNRSKAMGTLPAGNTLPSMMRACSASGVRSTTTTSSASSITRSGIVSPDDDARLLGDPRADALQVLHVDGGEDGDPGRQHVLDVLVALIVLEPGRVGVRELVDQADLRRAAQDRGQVHLLDDRALEGDAPARDQLEPVGQSGRLGPPVGLQQADRDILAFGGHGVALLEHAAGLADADRHAQEDLVLPAGHRELRRRARRAGAGRSA